HGRRRRHRRRVGSGRAARVERTGPSLRRVAVVPLRLRPRRDGGRRLHARQAPARLRRVRRRLAGASGSAHPDQPVPETGASTEAGRGGRRTMTSTVERLLSRRRFLKGSAGVAFALPWLELLDARSAHAAAAPTQRFVVMFSPNGTVASNWVPAGTESAF